MTLALLLIALLVNQSLAGRGNCDNSLVNGDAENGLSPWSSFGSGSIVTEQSNHVFQVPANTNSYFWQDVAIPPNAVRAYIHAWVRNTLPGQLNGLPSVSMYIQNASRFQVGAATLPWKSETYWTSTTISLLLSSYNGAANIRLFLERSAQTANTVYFDNVAIQFDCSVIPASPVCNGNYLQDGSANPSDSSWVPQYGAFKGAEQGNFFYRIPAGVNPRQGYFYTDVLVPNGASAAYFSFYSRSSVSGLQGAVPIISMYIQNASLFQIGSGLIVSNGPSVTTWALTSGSVNLTQYSGVYNLRIFIEKGGVPENSNTIDFDNIVVSFDCLINPPYPSSTCSNNVLLNGDASLGYNNWILVGNPPIQSIGGNNVFVIRNLTEYFAQNVTIPSGNFTTLRVAYWYRSQIAGRNEAPEVFLNFFDVNGQFWPGGTPSLFTLPTQTSWTLYYTDFNLAPYLAAKIVRINIGRLEYPGNVGYIDNVQISFGDCDYLPPQPQDGNSCTGNLVANPYADQGVSGWTAYGGAAIVTVNGNSVLRSQGNNPQYFWQDITVPSGYTTMTFGYWFKSSIANLNNNIPTFSMYIQNGTLFQIGGTLLLFKYPSSTSWDSASQTVDLTQYPGAANVRIFMDRVETGANVVDMDNIWLTFGNSCNFSLPRPVEGGVTTGGGASVTTGVTRQGSVTTGVTPTYGPDLAVDSFSITNNVIDVDTQIGATVTLTVTNLGTVNMPANVSIGLYVSSDDVISTSDRLVQGGREFLTSPVAPNAIVVVNFPAELTVSSTFPDTDPICGSAYLGVVLDEFNIGAETNENNNFASISVTINCDSTSGSQKIGIASGIFLFLISLL